MSKNPDRQRNIQTFEKQKCHFIPKDLISILNENINTIFLVLNKVVGGVTMQVAGVLMPKGFNWNKSIHVIDMLYPCYVVALEYSI